MVFSRRHLQHYEASWLGFSCGQAVLPTQFAGARITVSVVRMLQRPIGIPTFDQENFPAFPAAAAGVGRESESRDGLSSILIQEGAGPAQSIGPRLLVWLFTGSLPVFTLQSRKGGD